MRNPLMVAKAVASIDQMSGGRMILGTAAGWLREEWIAAGLDPRSRGRRLDEALAVCKRLWSEPVIEHHGEFYDFPPVAFEPKPVQKPWPRIHVGGESEAALYRAARHGDGWLGLGHTPETAAPLVARLRALREELELMGEPFEVSVGAGSPSPTERDAFAELGVDRLIVTPWRRSAEAVAGIEALARALEPGP